jgi:hypothetical protein
MRLCRLRAVRLGSFPDSTDTALALARGVNSLLLLHLAARSSPEREARAFWPGAAGMDQAHAPGYFLPTEKLSSNCAVNDAAE